jgi:hypothetical protein
MNRHKLGGNSGAFVTAIARFQMSAKIQVIFYSMYGHIYRLARKSGSHQTPRWRELDSNFQFRAKMATLCVVRDESDRPSAMSSEQFLKI